MNRITTRFARIFIDIDQVIRIETLADAKISLEDAEDAVAIANDFSKSGGELLLVDIRRNRRITSSAKLFFEKSDVHIKQKAKAILIKSTLLCLIKNGLKSYNSKYPVRIFTSEIEAIKWLYSFMK